MKAINFALGVLGGFCLAIGLVLLISTGNPINVISIFFGGFTVGMSIVNYQMMKELD